MPQNAAVLSRGAHRPSYRGSSSSTTVSSSNSTSSEAGGSSHVGGTGAQQPRPNYPATSVAGRVTGANVGGRMGMERLQYYNESSFRHHGQQGFVSGVPLHSDTPHYYRITGQQQSDSRYRMPPSHSTVGAMYNQPAQAYSTYPSDSYYGARRSNYSRPLSTGSLSSVTTASSRPGFSSLDEFPNMYDHRSTFVPHDEAGVAAQHRRYGDGGYGADARYSGSAQPNPYQYRQFHDHYTSASASSSVGAYVGSPTSPSSLCGDEHQPLLSLMQQGPSLVGEYSSDEMGGQLADEMSRTLNLQDQRTAASVQQEARGQRKSSRDDATHCIHIFEHPNDLEVCPNEKAVLRCTAKIVDGCGQKGRDCRGKGVEQREEEPNLLWYKDAEPLIGEIDSEYVVDAMTEKDVGMYYCLVSHPDDERIQRQSNTARLSIKMREEGTYLLCITCGLSKL